MKKWDFEVIGFYRSPGLAELAGRKLGVRSGRYKWFK